MALTARQCVPVSSSWVDSFIRMSDDTLSVLFKNGTCCHYPRSTLGMFQIAIVQSSPGEFVNQFLYRRMPYSKIKNPCPATTNVVTACCPANPTPQTLHGTITGGGALNGTYAMTYVAGTGWQWATTFGFCGRPQLACVGGVNLWRLTFGGAYNPSALTCTPLVITFGPVDLTACGGIAGATITVTV